MKLEEAYVARQRSHAFQDLAWCFRKSKIDNRGSYQFAERKVHELDERLSIDTVDHRFPSPGSQ